MGGEHLEVGLRARTRRSRPAAGEVEDDDPSRVGPDAARRAAPAPAGAGSRDVNHEPGPSTTQSASSTAATASGAGRRVLGHQRTATTRPRAVATATWPRTDAASRTRSGRRRGRRPRCRAATAAIGSTRPCAPEQPADPVEARRPGPEQLPERDDEQVADGVAGELARRWRTGAGATSLHVRPQSSSPQRAASAIRRSPGGRTPSSARSRPLDPPSSATVTTAVSRSGDLPRARCRRWRPGPWPPPERDDVEAGASRSGLGRHSRPRSRWTTRARSPVLAGAAAASSSAMATLRCLPPVQPTASVTKRLPSRR